MVLALGTAPEAHPSGASADVRAMGGKGAALARLTAEGFAVPPFCVLPPLAFEASRTAGALEAPTPEWAAAVHAWADASGADLFAVRSSAASEDGGAHSFAGQFETVLGVARGALSDAIATVWHSAFADRVLAYRTERGIDGPPEAPAVVIQAMVDARASGVAFGADPVTGDPSVRIIGAVHGLGTALVDGQEDGETWRLTASGEIASCTDGRQRQMHTLTSSGASTAAAPQTDVLSEDEARAVAALVAQATEAFGHPQDIEWAFGPLAGAEVGAEHDARGEPPHPSASRIPARGHARTSLFLLQSRPITTVQTGRLRVWDNSNIAESYGGVTSPLTFSFARRAYAAVYREFCRLLGVPEARIEAESETFDQMLGLLRGRVYYNLASWYRVLALLPGYQLNAEFMEGMMGVREGIPDEIRPTPLTTGRWRDQKMGRVRDGLALTGSAFGLVTAAFGLPRRQRRFMARVDRALAPVDLPAMDLDALAAHYRDLEAELLQKWDAPLVNDFFAMIAFGTAQKLADTWAPPGLLGHLLSGDGDIISAEPARRIRAMAEPLAPATGRALMSGDAAQVLRENEPLARAVADYLATFGDRCLEELKLESPTLADDPQPLYAAIGATALREVNPDAPRPLALRESAEAQLRDALRGHPLRAWIFRRALGLARRRVRDRENLRFERTRVFGRARRIVLAMGTRLVARGALSDPRDVFDLEIGELLGAVDGTGTAWDLRAIAAARREEFDAYRATPAPPERVLTRGAVSTATLVSGFTPEATGQASGAEGNTPDSSGATRSGLGCCAGIVDGPVRVVRDPRGVTLEPGTILVAERTDPGWILLFPMCSGLIVERGSLLSHSAIVAREMGIPCAVSVDGATAWLADGDRVRLDGATGLVTRITPEASVAVEAGTASGDA